MKCSATEMYTSAIHRVFKMQRMFSNIIFLFFVKNWKSKEAQLQESATANAFRLKIYHVLHSSHMKGTASITFAMCKNVQTDYILQGWGFVHTVARQRSWFGASKYIPTDFQLLCYVDIFPWQVFFAPHSFLLRKTELLACVQLAQMMWYDMISALSKIYLN